MKRVARQASGDDTGTTPITIDNTDTGAPLTSPTDTFGTTDAAATGVSPTVLVTTEPATTVAADTPAASDSGSDGNTATETTPDSTALPTSQATDQTFTSGGASDSTTSTSFTDPLPSLETGVSSESVSAQSISDSQSGLTDSASVSITASGSSISASDTSASPSLTSFVSLSTTESTSTTESSSSSTESTSSTDSSSSRTRTGSPSTSLTTSFTEVISTINGQVTTIFSPVATLSADTSSTLSSSNRTAIIAGGTAAGIALLILCLLAIFICRRRQKRREYQSHRYLPTPRSVMLAGEDDFDLAGPRQPQRGIGIFASRRRNNGLGEEYRDLGSDSGRDVSSPEMRELSSEPPPRLLRPVASKTGSYFQEAVWPPPDEGSRLCDPIMAASNVDLHSIVDEVMGPQGQSQPRRSSVEVSSTSSLPRPSRLRGGAVSSSESGTPTDYAPRIPTRHMESPTMSSIESGFVESPRHLRDWSTDSASGLLANMEGSTRGTRRSSGGSGAWLPAGAASPPVYGRAISPPSRLRMVTEPDQQTPNPAASSRARGKASEAAQERGSTLAVTNPSPEEENASSSVHASSFSVSTTSTQRLRRLAGLGTLEATGEETPYADESPVDRRSVPSSLAHAWLLDVGADEVDDPLTPRPQPGPRPREEIPPRYDMIRRDSENDDVLQGRTRTL